jgi:hypothetical protein
MLKRRLAIVGTAAVLGLAGMAGSALADDGLIEGHGDSAVVHTEPVFLGGKLTCWLSGGDVVKLSDAKVAELVHEKVIEPEHAWDVAADGVVPAERVKIAVPAKELPRKVVGKRWRHSRVIHLTCVWDEFRVK